VQYKGLHPPPSGSRCGWFSNPKARFQTFQGMAEGRGAHALLKARKAQIAMFRNRQKMAEIGKVRTADVHARSMASTTVYRKLLKPIHRSR
jgi:hypothetical protein